MISATNESDLSNEIVRAIHTKTGGNPMYIEQMTMYLHKKKLLRNCEDDMVNTDLALADFVRSTITVKHVFIEQMDMLRPSTQLTLKVAAIVGIHINSKIMVAMYPYNTSSISIERDLLDLENTGFLQQVKQNSLDVTWQFFNQVARDVVYELIPHYQRRLLHSNFAHVLCTQDNKVQIFALCVVLDKYML